MRASRLLSFLLLLQARGHMTADDLAEELEVSVRTIYRDAEALLQAGVPLIASSGPEGGYRLDGGYRTRLNGLTESEARGIFLTGLPGPAAELGLGAALATAQLKLSSALPPSLTEQANLTLERFHLDPVGWYASPEPVAHLATVADAVWERRRIELQYRRWEDPEEVLRQVEPYGLVLKSGRWYLVAAAGGTFRTYRVSQILQITASGEEFERAPDFDLAAYWTSYLRDFHERLTSATAVVRLSRNGLARARLLLSGLVYELVQETASEPDVDGWVRAEVPIETLEFTESELLRLGSDLEVLAPRSLRSKLKETAGRLQAMYA
jgi:predicted DNA-binding transcriptional regulator YafY